MSFTRVIIICQFYSSIITLILFLTLLISSENVTSVIYDILHDCKIWEMALLVSPISKNKDAVFIFVDFDTWFCHLLSPSTILFCMMYILWCFVVMMLLKIRKFNIFLQVTHLHFHIFNIVYRDQRLWIPSLLPKNYVSYREGMQIICVIRFIPELPIWYLQACLTYSLVYRICSAICLQGWTNSAGPWAILWIWYLFEDGSNWRLDSTDAKWW